MRRVAILLNRNAQRVTPRVVGLIAAHASSDGMFVTASLDEARAAVAQVVARDYDVLCVGGGDGTFMRAVTDLAELRPARWPALFALRLGSGNAMPDVCGASSADAAGLARDLARAAADESPRPLALLAIDDALTPTVGVGLDAKFNEDLDHVVKRRMRGNGLGRLVRGATGLVITASTRTLPRLLREPSLAVRLIAVDGPAHLLDETGAPTGDVYAPGTVLHAGQVTIASASTIATYGRGLQFFPFADRLGDRFQLRVSRASARVVVSNLSRIFDGTYRDPERLWDYAVCGVRFELPGGGSFHMSGELHHGVTSFTVRRASFAVPILRARPS